MQQPNPIDQIISIADLCRLLGKTRITIWRWQKAGRLPSAIRLGPNSVGFRKSDIQHWLDTRPDA